jgi:hypothetical protein
LFAPSGVSGCLDFERCRGRLTNSPLKANRVSQFGIAAGIGGGVAGLTALFILSQLVQVESLRAEFLAGELDEVGVVGEEEDL